MADKTIGELPVAEELYNDSLLVVEQQREARSIRGELVADFAREAAAADVQRAVDAAAAAEKSAGAAKTDADRAEELRQSIELDYEYIDTARTEAQASARAAETSAQNAKGSEDVAKASQEEAAKSEQNSASSAEQAKASEGTAKAAQEAAQASKDEASASESAAAAYANAAKDSETSAGDSAAAAAKSAADGSEYATAAQSYAVGDTGSREGEEVDNAKYYYEQAKRISQGLAGALLPMGTVSFEQLASQSKQAGYMYNISDAFTTDDTFREGEGHAYPAGTNVYYTAEGEWDCLAGAQVVSVNGKTGAVEITPANIGAYTKAEVDARSGVTSVNSKTGAVTLSAEDVGAPTMKDSEFDWAALEGSTPSGNMGGLYWNKGKFLYAGCRDERGEEQWSGQLYGEMNPPPGLDDQRLLAEAADDRLVGATIYNLDNAMDYAIMGGYAPDGAKVTFAFNRGERCVYAAAVDNTGHQQWNQCLYSNGNPQPSVEKLSTPRNINGVAFDGSADINVPAVKQIVFVSGGIANAIGGVYEGAGAALVTEYVGGLAKIDFTITTTVEDSTESPACYRWGLNRDLLASKGAPMIEPANGGILQIFDLSQDGGRLQTGLTDLSGSVTPNSPFWVPARVYKTDGAVGTWQSSIMKTRWVIIGTVYGTVI